MIDLELEELVCNIIEEAGDNGIDPENNISLYEAVQKLKPYGNLETEVDKVLETLERGNFIKIEQNKQGRVVCLLKDKSITISVIRDYFN